jgi:hypothetical protein
MRGMMWTIDVCEDCHAAHAGVVEGPEPVPAPLSAIGEGVRVSDGCGVCPPCDHPDCNYGPVCGCGWGDPGHGFSWARCQGCGSQLGGNRYPLTLEAIPANV